MKRICMLTPKLIPALEICILIVSFILISVKAVSTELNAYMCTVVPTIDGSIAPGEWEDTSIFDETTSGTKVAFKHDGKNLYILATFTKLHPISNDFLSLEFDNNGDGAPMGSNISPDDAILVSPMFAPNNARDAFLRGFEKPVYDDEAGGTNDVEGKMVDSKRKYVIEIKRPFVTDDAAGYDVNFSPEMVMGVGFATGELGKGLAHSVTDMEKYVLAIKSEKYAIERVEKLDLPTWDVLVLNGVVLIAVVSFFAVIIFTRRKVNRGG